MKILHCREIPFLFIIFYQPIWFGFVDGHKAYLVTLEDGLDLTTNFLCLRFLFCIVLNNFDPPLKMRSKIPLINYVLFGCAGNAIYFFFYILSVLIPQAFLYHLIFYFLMSFLVDLHYFLLLVWSANQLLMSFIPQFYWFLVQFYRKMCEF